MDHRPHNLCDEERIARHGNASQARGVRRRHESGFTLIELIIVLTILGVLAAAVVPLFRASTEKMREERAMRDLYASLKFAQERSISEMTEYRLYLDTKGNRYWTARLANETDGKKTFTEITEPSNDVTVLPDGVTLTKPKARQDRKLDASYVAFYPNGACDVASITLERKNGKAMTVSTKGKLGQFKTQEGR
jgi:type II secretion system protein H